MIDKKLSNIWIFYSFNNLHDYIHSNERIFVIILWKEIFGSCGIYNFYQILTEYSNFRGSSFKIY